MLDSIIAWSWPEAFHDFGFVHHGDDDWTEGSGHTPEVKYERDLIYSTGTKGEFMTIGINSDAEWKRLSSALGRLEWTTDPRFATARARATNKVERLNLIESVICTMPVEEVGRRLRENDVAFAQINHPRHRVLADPQVRHNQTVVEYEHPHTPTGKVRQARPAAMFSDQPFQVRHVAPLLGQDTLEVLSKTLSMSTEEIEKLSSQGVVQITQGGEAKKKDWDQKKMISAPSSRI